MSFTFQPLYDPGRSPSTYSIGGWGPTASVYILEKILFCIPKSKLNRPNPLPSHYIDLVVLGTMINVGQFNPNSAISPLCVSAGGS